MEALVEGRADATTMCGLCGDRRRPFPSQTGRPELPESNAADRVAYLIALGLMRAHGIDLSVLPECLARCVKTPALIFDRVLGSSLTFEAQIVGRQQT